METFERSIELNVPVEQAYDKWSRFEDFPRFMHDVLEVRRLEENRHRWRVKACGQELEWDSEITGRVPDKQIAWRATGGEMRSGTAVFESAGAGKSRVKLILQYEPATFVSRFADALGIAARRIEMDMKRFKEAVEAERLQSQPETNTETLNHVT